MQIQERPEETLPGTENKSSLKAHGLYRLGLSYGRQVYRFRWFIIAFWIGIVLVSVPFAAKVGSVLTGGGYSYKNSESAQADALLKAKLPSPGTNGLYY